MKTWYLKIGTGGAVPSRAEDSAPTGSGKDAASPSGEWTDTAPSFTNAGANVVWYKVSAVNCEDYVHAAVNIIMKRPVTLTADSSSWVFDGQAHSNATVIVSGEFVAGEGAEYAGFPTITEVGVKTNTFTAAGNPFAGGFEPTRPGENWG